MQVEQTVHSALLVNVCKQMLPVAPDNLLFDNLTSSNFAMSDQLAGSVPEQSRDKISRLILSAWLLPSRQCQTASHASVVNSAPIDTCQGIVISKQSVQKRHA